MNAESLIGQTIAHYRIDERLGDGGMGIVYGAADLRISRRVAIKVLRANRIGDAERERRFVQEARAASALNHPNIITIYDIDRAEGIVFIAMEYVPGQTLDRLIEDKRLPSTISTRRGSR
jgi:serine/threonine-protein kinase